MSGINKRVQRNKLRAMSKEDLARVILPDVEDIKESVENLVKIKTILLDPETFTNEGIDESNAEVLLEDVNVAIKNGDAAIHIYGDKTPDELTDVEVSAISIANATIETKVSSLNQFISLLDISKDLQNIQGE
jgi:hypothetical protein